VAAGLPSKRHSVPLRRNSNTEEVIMEITAAAGYDRAAATRAHAERASGRKVAWAGATFAAAFLISFLFGARSDIHEAPGHTLANYATDTNKLKGGIAWVAAVLAVFALVWFLAGLVSLIRAAGGTATQTLAVTFAGSLLAAAVTVASAIRAAPIGDLLLDNEKRAGTTGKLTPAFAHLAQTTGTLYDWLLFFAVGLAGAAFVLAVTLASRRTHVLPRWLCWAGFATVPLLAFFAFVNILLLAAWFIAASIAIARSQTGRHLPT
jgi:hypothetical protein